VLLNQINQSHEQQKTELQRIASLMRDAAQALRNEANQLDKISAFLVGSDTAEDKFQAFESGIRQVAAVNVEQPKIGLDTRYKGRHLVDSKGGPLPSAED
jgi:hypothetical protein